MSVKISIIIPVYNAEQYIRVCLDTIRAQTMPDWECLCIDDGSTDNSAGILAEYASSDSRFKVIRQANAGPGAARNRGLDAACGEYVMFMDPDDYYPNSNVFETLYGKAIETGCVVVGGRIRCVKQNSSPQQEVFRALECPRKLGRVNYAEVQGFFWYTSYIYQRKHIDEHKIRFPAFRRRQDPPFLIEALATAGCYYAISDDVYSYRIRDTESARMDWKKDGGVKLRDAMKGINCVADLADKYGFGKMYAENAITVTGMDAFATWEEVKLAERELREFIGRLKRSDKMTYSAWRGIFITLLSGEKGIIRRLRLEADILGVKIVLVCMAIVVASKVKKMLMHR